jgi:tRNA 2-thiouridine synthesizing protein A
VKSAQLKVDARKMPCPMPLLKLKQALNQLDIGQLVHLVATDPTSKRDFVSYIEMTNHQLSYEEKQNEIHFHVIKG